MVAKSRTRPNVTGNVTVDRALLVLTAFRKGDSSLELTELAQRTGLDKTTVMRMAVSLEKAELIMRLDDGTYQLDAGVLRLGSVYQQSFDLERHVMPVLKTLVKQLEETATFYVRRGNHRLCLYRVDSRHLLREHVRPGDLRPLDDSAVAKALKAFDARKPPTADMLAQFPLLSSGQTDPHTASLAMPVFRLGDALAGALAITGPVTRLTPQKAACSREIVREAGLRLTRALGGLVTERGVQDTSRGSKVTSA